MVPIEVGLFPDPTLTHTLLKKMAPVYVGLFDKHEALAFMGGRAHQRREQSRCCRCLEGEEGGKRTGGQTCAPSWMALSPPHPSGSTASPPIQSMKPGFKQACAPPNSNSPSPRPGIRRKHSLESRAWASCPALAVAFCHRMQAPGFIFCAAKHGRLTGP